jgi:hypothetical protein
VAVTESAPSVNCCVIISTACLLAKSTKEETETVENMEQPAETEPQDSVASGLYVFVQNTPIFTGIACNTGLEVAEVMGENETQSNKEAMPTAGLEHDINHEEEVATEETAVPVELKANQTEKEDSIEERSSAEDMQTQASLQSKQAGEAGSVGEPVDIEVQSSKASEALANEPTVKIEEGDVVEEQTEITTEVVTQPTRNQPRQRRRKGKTDSTSEDTIEQKELKSPPDETSDTKPQVDKTSTVERRQKPCSILPFAVVLIALTLAILIVVFVKDLSFFFKALLIFLPSAALLLMTVTELRQRL